MEQNLHLKSNPQISIDEAWRSTNQIVIDVRSPNEYIAGSFPAAINIPLLENEERETIGILYKHFGQKKAVEKGYNILDNKLDGFTRQFKEIPFDQNITVYCARGGMRSQVVTSFLRHLGYNTRQLTGGYKAFRNWNLDRLNTFQFNNPFVLHGKTGVGKTLVLYQLENALDLEGLADHRGSIFGGVGKNPVTQKTFEANLLINLEKLDNSKPIFIEGESRKIGDVSIPDPIFRQMKTSKNILLEASIETRVARTIEEYITRQQDSIEPIRTIIGQLESDLGKKPVANLIDLFDKKDYAGCFETILLNYYDRKYSHSMKKLQFTTVISTDNINQACKKITEHASSLQK